MPVVIKQLNNGKKVTEDISATEPNGIKLVCKLFLDVLLQEISFFRGYHRKYTDYSSTYISLLVWSIMDTNDHCFLCAYALSGWMTVHMVSFEICTQLHFHMYSLKTTVNTRICTQARSHTK